MDATVSANAVRYRKSKGRVMASKLDLLRTAAPKRISSYGSNQWANITSCGLEVVGLPQEYEGMLVRGRIYYRTRKQAQEALDALIDAAEKRASDASKV